MTAQYAPNEPPGTAARKRPRSYCHRGGVEPLLGSTIGEHFDAMARRFARREAVVGLPQRRRLNYAELSRAVETLGRGLLGLGFGAGERIGIWSTNNIEWLMVQLATARIGIVLVNINPAYGKAELAYALARSELNGLIVIPSFRHSDYVGILRDLVPALDRERPGHWHSDRLPNLRRILVYDPSAPATTARPGPGFDVWADLEAAAAAVTPASLAQAARAVEVDDPVNIQYTSGTTGFPKAVVLTHHNILNNAWFAARAMRLTERDRLCVPVPFYHCFGMVLANLVCASVGAALVIPCEHFDAVAVLAAIEQERCTAVHGVPTMFVAELDHPRFAQFDLTSLRTGIMAGAPCPPALMRRVMQEMGCSQILIGYGETEASPLTHLTSADDTPERRVETVGRNLPHQEVKVIDPASGRTLPLEQTGEICFRGYHLMRGYYGDPQATAGAIDANGWLHSGDLGSMDAQGYLRITGRLKEMIIRGGENIYPREIETRLFAHPKVAQAAVFGIPDDYYGEIVCAWVQLHPGESATEAELREHCRRGLAGFKVPARIRFVERFPMTVTGKLQKFRMREIECEQTTGAAPA